MKVPPENERCLYAKTNGSQCRRLRLPGQSLCLYHSRRSVREAAIAERNQQNIVRQYFQGETAAQLFPNRRDRLDTAKGVNRFLARVARLVAEGRLEPRIGAALCYIAQTLLATLPHLKREHAARIQSRQNPLLSDEQIDAVNKLFRTIDECIEAENQPGATSSGDEADQSEPTEDGHDPEPVQ